MKQKTPGTLPSWIDTTAFPFESHTAPTATGPIHYVDEGEGPPLLLLHPAPATLFFYKRVILGLRDRFRIIAPDFPGFGLSPVPPTFDGRLRSYADVANQLVDYLNLEHVTLLVNDSSGPIGLDAAARRSERYQSLIITDTFGFPLRGRLRLIRFVLRHVISSWPVRALNRRLNLMAWAVSTVAPYRNLLPKRDRILYQQFFSTPASRDRIIEVFEQLGRDDAHHARVETGIRERLGDKNVLLIFGQFDPMRILGCAARFRELFPNAHQEIIRGDEHFPILGSADAVTDAIKSWYDRLSSSEQIKSWAKVEPRRASV